jgi:hypothetical protein
MVEKESEITQDKRAAGLEAGAQFTGTNVLALLVQKYKY